MFYLEDMVNVFVVSDLVIGSVGVILLVEIMVFGKLFIIIFKVYIVENY